MATDEGEGVRRVFTLRFADRVGLARAPDLQVLSAQPGQRWLPGGDSRHPVISDLVISCHGWPTLRLMPALQTATVPESVPLGASFFIGARRFTARLNRQGERIWVGLDRRFVEVVLLRTDNQRYAVAPWLEDAAPRAMRELIRSGVLVPPDPLTMLDEPTASDDANDAALRVAVIEGLLETAQLTLDDAWQSLRAWRALRDASTRQ